ncbi:MAG: hypothetical protein RMJ13_07800 [Elusimicrobiota bacterium]|nr:hypothetical protein [Elusimicrobiota bacterium]
MKKYLIISLFIFNFCYSDFKTVVIATRPYVTKTYADNIEVQDHWEPWLFSSTNTEFSTYNRMILIGRNTSLQIVGANDTVGMAHLILTGVGSDNSNIHWYINALGCDRNNDFTLAVRQSKGSREFAPWPWLGFEVLTISTHGKVYFHYPEISFLFDRHPDREGKLLFVSSYTMMGIYGSYDKLGFFDWKRGYGIATFGNNIEFFRNVNNFGHVYHSGNIHLDTTYGERQIIFQSTSSKLGIFADRNKLGIYDWYNNYGIATLSSDIQLFRKTTFYDEVNFLGKQNIVNDVKFCRATNEERQLVFNSVNTKRGMFENDYNFGFYDWKNNKFIMNLVNQNGETEFFNDIKFDINGGEKRIKFIGSNTSRGLYSNVNALGFYNWQYNYPYVSFADDTYIHTKLYAGDIDCNKIKSTGIEFDVSSNSEKQIKWKSNNVEFGLYGNENAIGIYDWKNGKNIMLCNKDSFVVDTIFNVNNDIFSKNIILNTSGEERQIKFGDIGIYGDGSKIGIYDWANNVNCLEVSSIACKINTKIEMTGVRDIVSSISDGKILICGGKSWDDGTFLELYGKDSSDKLIKMQLWEGGHLQLYTYGSWLTQMRVYANGGVRIGNSNINPGANNLGVDGNVYINGDLEVNGVKNFVQKLSDGSIVKYTSIESDEILLLWRGEGIIKNGKAEIYLTKHFNEIAEEPVTVHLTKLSRGDVWLEKKEISKNKIIIAGEENTKFSYLILANRKLK